MKILVLIVCLSLLSAVVLARDLNVVAKKERSRRHALRSSGLTARAFTNDDLAIYARGREPSTLESKDTISLAPGRDLDKEKSYWQQESLRHARDLARMDARIKKLEWRLRDYRIKRSLKRGIRDDPSASLIEESLESLREERREMELDFRERARKAGAFPGWLR